MRFILSKSILYAALTVFCCIVLVAQVADGPTNDPDHIKKTLRKVHYGDVIDIDVVGSFEYDWRAKLNPEGFLDGPDKFGLELYGLCKTEEEIASEIAKEYSRLLRDPKIVVRILDTSQRPAAILNGAVRSPHRFNIRRPVRLNELIVITGGLFDTLSGEVSIFRPAESSCAVKNSSDEARPEIINLKISELLSGDPRSNPYILPGDLVTVLDAKPIYVIGGVRNPRTIPSRADVTLTRAIAAAGGISRTAVDSAIIIFRHENGSVTRLEADLAAITSGKADDIQLKALDIVDIPIRGSGTKEQAPVIENERLFANEGQNMPTRTIE